MFGASAERCGLCMSDKKRIKALAYFAKSIQDSQLLYLYSYLRIPLSERGKMDRTVRAKWCSVGEEGHMISVGLFLFYFFIFCFFLFFLYF